MSYLPVIGLELHIQMKTKSKMFSSAPVSFGKAPNTSVAPLDIAFPGTLPLINKQAVINGIRVSHALHMRIDNELWFDRKNYFYSDLPKGYQITQEKRPLGRDGYLIINGKKIGIERLHLEEDTAKQLHFKDHSLLDYNRAGIPLLEIVTTPTLNSGIEAMKFVEEIRSIVTFLDVSDGKMEEGSLRCDVNVSLKRDDDDSFGTKVEIKNINTLNNIARAINYEIDRQTALLDKGEIVAQETRRYDEGSKRTISMRIKIDSVDYKPFFEPNLLPIKLTDDFIDKAIKTSPELASQKKDRYLALGLNKYNCSLLLNNKETSDYFDQTILSGANPVLVANWINVDIQTILKKNDMRISDFPVKPNDLGKLIKLIEEDKVSNRQARTIFIKMISGNDSLESIIEMVGISLISEEKTLLNLINEVLNEHPQLIIDFKNGKNRVIGFVVGQIMKKTDGKASPSLTNKLVRQELERR